MCLAFFFFSGTPATGIYTLSLHDALPIFGCPPGARSSEALVEGLLVGRLLARREEHREPPVGDLGGQGHVLRPLRSEEHTSELQSPCNLVCRLLLEKKKNENAIYARRHTC